MFLAETYMDLMTDSAHWAFEITLMVIFDVIIGMIAWPLVKRAILNHDKKAHNCDHQSTSPWAHAAMTED